MGNCQAIDAAALVIQHPDGRIERLYYPINVSEVMKMNPGHYVSLIIPLSSDDEEGNQESQKVVRFTRVKLLRSTDTLALGHAYRLVTSEEVMKVLKAKKYAKTKREKPQSTEMAPEKRSSSLDHGENKSDAEKSYREKKQERRGTAMKPKPWRPSLQSISEASSTNMNLDGPQMGC